MIRRTIEDWMSEQLSETSQTMPLGIPSADSLRRMRDQRRLWRRRAGMVCCSVCLAGLLFVVRSGDDHIAEVDPPDLPEQVAVGESDRGLSSPTLIPAADLPCQTKILADEVIQPRWQVRAVPVGYERQTVLFVRDSETGQTFTTMRDVKRPPRHVPLWQLPHDVQSQVEHNWRAAGYWSDGEI